MLQREEGVVCDVVAKMPFHVAKRELHCLYSHLKGYIVKLGIYGGCEIVDKSWTC